MLSACLTEFKCDPFDTNQTLRSLQSGIRTSDALVADLKSAKEDGTSKLKQFMHDRVYFKTKSLNDRVFRSKRKNFSTQELKKADGDNLKGKTKEMERKALVSVLGLVETSGALKLEEVLQHCVTAECLSIFNVNGTIRKAQKSKLQ